MSRIDQIISQSAMLFYQKGFQATSMREIAAQLNIKAASLYNHINAKEDLLAAIIMRLANEFVDHIQQTAKENSSPVDQLEAIIQHHIQVNIHQSESLAILNNDWIYLADMDKLAFIELRTTYENHLRDIIKVGIEQQDIKNIHPDIIIFSMLSSLRNLHLWYKKHHIDENQLQKELSELLINGFLVE
jgi:AcrR family transcriptional regulator